MAKVTVKQLQKKYKDANECVSVQRSPFNMNDYDIESIYYDSQFEGFFIKDKNGDNDKQLYDIRYEWYAGIIN